MSLSYLVAIYLFALKLVTPMWMLC